MRSRTIPGGRGAFLVAALAATVLAFSFAASAPAAPPVGDGTGGVKLTRIGNFDEPVYSTTAPGKANRGLIYVVERGGTIRVIRNEKVLRKPFLDISNRINSDFSEQGLLSVAFDPDYGVNRRFYVYFTAADGAITVRRYKRKPGAQVTDSGSGRAVISIPHAQAPNHNGGEVTFGPGGHMYLATGDGGAGCNVFGNAQDTDSLLGKLLRIDPRAGGGYTIPDGNPFARGPGADEIYSYGLRNPFRFSFDGDRIAIGDVGQNAWEEIDYLSLKQAKGANFGWSGYEGFTPEPCGTPAMQGTTLPIFAYPHSSDNPDTYTGCAITGGPVVRDRRLKSLYGRYLYSDFCTGGLQSLIPPADGGRATDDHAVGPDVNQLSSITNGRDDRVYATSLLGNIYRLDPRRKGGAARAVDRAGGLGVRKVGDFEQPVYVDGPPRSHGQLFVVEKAGVVKTIGRRGKVGTFLDIRNKVSDDGERGLLSIAFPPGYRQSGLFYVYYTDKRGDIVVAEFRRSRKDPGTASAASRRMVIRIGHRENANHNGGQLQFGPDGYLYLATGDGGSGGDPPENAQNTASLLGKLIRIDPRKQGSQPYTVPASNPFVGGPGRDEIYAYGLRNPYRFSFDRADGHLTIGDVGQDSWEEIDYLSPEAALGANFGWDAYEGFGPFASSDASPPPAGPVTAPIAQFSHSDGWCAITGGYVYRGTHAPSLEGRYVYSDYCRGQIRSLVPAEGGASDDRPIGVKRFSGISSFGEDAKGNLYFTDLNGGGVYEIVAKAGS